MNGMLVDSREEEQQTSRRKRETWREKDNY